MPIPLVPLIVAGALATLAFKSCETQKTDNAKRVEMDQQIFDYAQKIAEYTVEVTAAAGKAAEHTKTEELVPIAVRDGMGTVRTFAFTKNNASLVVKFAGKFGRVAQFAGGPLKMLDLANQTATPEFFSGVKSIVTQESNFQQAAALRELEKE